MLKEDLDLELDFERNPFGLDVPPRTVDVDVDVDVDFDVGVVAVNRSSADKQSSGIIVLIVLV